ncbi:MAG: hypothetical protein HQL30_05655 [Candidatus Omnitrophica bacterium]|nr:hypothetical protein [Candidatus Omnitrophota bacterium]
MTENTSKKNNAEEVSDPKKQVKQDKPASPEINEAPAEAGRDAASTDATPGKKGFTQKTTAFVKPVECGACGKAFPKKMSYYRNGAFYCNKQCFKKKKVEGKAKAEESKQK